MNSLKAKWFPHIEPSNIELHAWHIINQKGIFKLLGRKKSLDLLEESFHLIAQIDCTFVASVIHKSRCYSRLSTDDIEIWSHRLLFERICKYLAKENAKRISANQTPEVGILLIDSIETKYDNKIRRIYRDYLRTGTYYITNQYLIEDPLFVDSQYRNMSQIVDIVAHLVNRYTNLKTKPKATWNDIDDVIARGYQIVKSRFDTCPNGQIFGCGIKHFP